MTQVNPLFCVGVLLATLFSLFLSVTSYYINSIDTLVVGVFAFGVFFTILFDILINVKTEKESKSRKKWRKL